MSIQSGYKKVKDYILESSGYKLLSRWTSSNTVEFDDGQTAETKVGAVKGITASTTATDTGYAASATQMNPNVSGSLAAKVDQLDKSMVENINSLNLKLDGNATYSTNEVNTHKKWINGRDIYRKIYNIATIPANTVTCIDSTMNALKIQSIVYFEGCATDKNNALVPIPYHNGQQYAYDNYWYITTSGLYITTMSLGGLSQATITIEYVKKS